MNINKFIFATQNYTDNLKEDIVYDTNKDKNEHNNTCN